MHRNRNVVVGRIWLACTVNVGSIEMAVHSFSTGLQTLINNNFIMLIELIYSTIAQKSLSAVQTRLIIYVTQLGVFL